MLIWLALEFIIVYHNHDNFAAHSSQLKNWSLWLLILFIKTVLCREPGFRCPKPAHPPALIPCTYTKSDIDIATKLFVWCNIDLMPPVMSYVKSRKRHQYRLQKYDIVIGVCSVLFDFVQAKFAHIVKSAASVFRTFSKSLCCDVIERTTIRVVNERMSKWLVFYFH